MAAEEENNKKNEGKGFAGLSSLVSDVDTTPPPPAPKTESAGSTMSTGRPAAQTAQPQPQQPTQRQTYQEPPQPSSGSSGGKWLLGIAAVVGLLWLIGQSNKPTSSPATAYSPPAQSAAPSYSPPAQPQAPSVPQESKPPVGQDLVFSMAQIRYCLAEDIRIEGAKAALNNYSDSDVDRFNAMVADYNSRCSSFKYQTNNRGRNDLNSAQRDIEPYRSQLQAEGRSRFTRSPSTGSLSAPAPARPAADETVRAVQQKLNELGYNAGPADGLMGRGTRAAIIAFQQDRGLAATGVADQTLLFQLRQVTSGSARGSDANAPSRSSPSATAPPFVPPTPSVQRSGPPANSWVSGSNWYCNDGYKKVGNSCEKLNVPRNAWVSGSNWYCNDGFKKVGDQCEALNVPANAWVSGSNWYCNDGYRKVGERCERLNVPQNAWVSGANWYCNDGFRKVGDQCVALNVPANAWVSGSNWYCNDGYRKVGEKCVSVYER